MVKLLTNISTMRLHEILTKLNEVLVKLQFYKELPFPMIDRQIEKLGRLK